MSFYFLNESIRSLGTSTVPSLDFPVKIQTSTWEHLEDPNRISRRFSFANLEQVKYFISEVLDVTEVRNHEISMMIEGREVTVETYTHDIQDVTNLDLEIARACDQIFKDSRYVKEHI